MQLNYVPNISFTVDSTRKSEYVVWRENNIGRKRNIDHKINLSELYGMAVALGYNPSEIVHEDMYIFVLNNLPSVEWFNSQLDYIRKLPEGIRKYIDAYMNYDYESINADLRDNVISRRSRELQNAIFNSPPANKIYTVFRYVLDVDYIDSNEFISKGFLSTTVNYNHAIAAVHENQPYGILLRISIPPSIPGLYIEGRINEYEIIFPYNIILTVTDKSNSDYYNPETGTFVILPTIDLIISGYVQPN